MVYPFTQTAEPALAAGFIATNYRHHHHMGQSQVELNRAMKGASFRRVNHAELEPSPWAKLRWLVRRVFWPKAGILVRLRSLWVTIPVRKISHFYF